MAMHCSRGVDLDCSEATPTPGLDGEIVEISLLLPGWQALELEKEAHERGLTAAQMVRHLLGHYFEKV
jgi:hypothetical protein